MSGRKIILICRFILSVVILSLFFVLNFDHYIYFFFSLSKSSMVMKSIFLPVTMFLLAFFTLINNTSSTLMSPRIDHQHLRHLQQGSTPAGQQINPSSPVVQVQPLTGMNAYLPADRSSAGSKSSKPIE